MTPKGTLARACERKGDGQLIIDTKIDKVTLGECIPPGSEDKAP